MAGRLVIAVDPRVYQTASLHPIGNGFQRIRHALRYLGKFRDVLFLRGRDESSEYCVWFYGQPEDTDRLRDNRRNYSIAFDGNRQVIALRCC